MLQEEKKSMNELTLTLTLTLTNVRMSILILNIWNEVSINTTSTIDRNKCCRDTTEMCMRYQYSSQEQLIHVYVSDAQ